MTFFEYVEKKGFVLIKDYKHQSGLWSKTYLKNNESIVFHSYLYGVPCSVNINGFPFYLPTDEDQFEPTYYMLGNPAPSIIGDFSYIKTFNKNSSFFERKQNF